MLLNQVDLLTPPIGLFFRGKGSHSSIASGIFTLLAYLIIAYFAVRYSLEFIRKKKPTAYFVNRHIEDAGIYNFNSTSFFHYIYLRQKKDRELLEFDFDLFRIIGFDSKSIEIFISSNPPNYEDFDHWIYGKCDIDTDTKDIKYLINIEEFSNAACLKKFYNQTTKTYYDINDTNFVAQKLLHGMTNENYNFYQIIVERCKEDNLRNLSGLGTCKSKEEIENSIENYWINIKILDNYPDVLNYNHPFTNYFYSINNGLYKHSFTAIDINFNPALLKTNYGIVFDRSKTIYTYMVDSVLRVVNNEEIELIDDEGKKIYDDNKEIMTKSSGFISSFAFYLGNRMQHYERTYIKLQDLLSKIGGFGKTTFIICTTLNILICKFITILDTEDFLLSLKNNINTNNDDTMCNINKDTYENKKIFSNIKNPNIYENKYLDQQLQGNEISKIKQIDKINIKNNINIKDEPKLHNSESNKNIKSSIKDSYLQTEVLLNKPGGRCNFCWCQYIWYMICCGTSNKNITFYENVRKRILSEENIIISHYNLYKLISILGLDSNEELILDKKYITIFQ